MSLPEVSTKPVRIDEETCIRLAQELQAFWDREQDDWDAQVKGNAAPTPDLWESMPIVDSKTVARMAPIFEKYEGRRFDVKRIRPGGYSSINNMIEHLVYEE